MIMGNNHLILLVSENNEYNGATPPNLFGAKRTNETPYLILVLRCFIYKKATHSFPLQL